MEVAAGGGGGVVIQGDPGPLQSAAAQYAKVGAAMGAVASKLLSTLGSVSSWEGAGANAHASRVQALASAHQVASDALLAGSQALTTYARELADAQALANRANNAADEATTTAWQLQAMRNKESSASNKPNDPYFAARYGDFGPGQSPAQQDAAKAAQLQSKLDDENRAATKFANEATAKAAAAGNKAAAAFNAVAQLAGNPADRGTSGSLASYLGAPSAASANQMVLQAETAMAGSPKAQQAAAAALANGQGPPTPAQKKKIADLKSKIWQPLPQGFSSWPPALQISWLNSIYTDEQSEADTEGLAMLAMGYGSVGEADAGGDDGGDDGDPSGADPGTDANGFDGAVAAMISGSDDIPPGLDPGNDSVPLAPNGGLNGNEGPQGNGGHTLAQHVDPDLNYLNQRLDSNPNMKMASVYTNRATAEAATDSAIAANKNAIDNWLSGSGKKLALPTWTAPDEVGVGLDQTTRQVVGLHNVQVVLVRSSNYPSGYYVLTSYPKQ